MTVEELRDNLFEIIQGYFAGATVRWGEQNSARPTTPFIRLKLNSLRRPQHSIRQVENDVPRGYFESTITLTVELFTHGRQIVDEDGDSYFVNTAVDDMVDFVNYMTSFHADDVYDLLDISVRPEGDVLDTSAVLDSDYEYRAMQEFIVSFIQETDGYAGIAKNNWKPTPSGGGTAELANKKISDIDCRNIKIENNKEDNL